MATPASSAGVSSIRLPVGPSRLDAPLLLKPGQQLQARVLSSNEQGQGRLALAGRTLEAQLPPGVAAGQRLSLQVRELSATQVVLEMVKIQAGPELAASTTRALQRTAGELIMARDPEALATALSLANRASEGRAEGGPYNAAGASAAEQSAAAAAAPSTLPGPADQAVPLSPPLVLEMPAQRMAEVQVEEREAREGAAYEPGAARLVLHGHKLGPVEIILRMQGNLLSVEVVADAESVALLRASETSLREALGARLPHHAQISVRQRGSDQLRPVDPRGFEVYG